MKHLTPCLVVFAASAVSVISGKSSSRRANEERGARTTFTPKIELDDEENRVAVPECNNCLFPKSMDIPNFCKKSIPRIGLEI